MQYNFVYIAVTTIPTNNSIKKNELNIYCIHIEIQTVIIRGSFWYYFPVLNNFCRE